MKSTEALYKERGFYELVKKLYPNGLGWLSQINKNYTSQQLEDVLFNGFAQLYKFDYKTQLTGDFMEDRIVFDSTLTPFIESDDYELFREIILNSDLDTFNAFLNAMERLANCEDMCISTSFLKAGIFKFMNYEFLRDKPIDVKKIELVCSSEILNKKDNICDDNFVKAKEKSKMYNLMSMSKTSEINKVYDAYWAYSLIVMSVLHKNKIIYDNFLTCNLDEFVSQPMTGYGIQQYFGLSDFKKVNLSVFKDEDLLNKFTIETLIELEQELDTKGKLKAQLAEFIYKHANSEQLKKMLITTLHKLDDKAIKVECELLPGVFDTLTGEDIQNYRMTAMVSAKYRNAKGKTKVIEKFKLENSDNIVLDWFMCMKTQQERKMLKGQLAEVASDKENIPRI